MGFVDEGNAFDRVPQGFLRRYSRGIGNQPPWLGLVSPCRPSVRAAWAAGSWTLPILFIIFVDRVSTCSIGLQRFSFGLLGIRSC